MKVEHYETVTQQDVEMEGAEGCQVRWLMGPASGAPNFAMRQFEIAPGGRTPRHHHPYEHEVFILEGTGVVIEGDTPRPIHTGDVVFIEPDDVHQFRNTGTHALKFLCLIPNSATSQQVRVVPEV